MVLLEPWHLAVPFAEAAASVSNVKVREVLAESTSSVAIQPTVTIATFLGRNQNPTQLYVSHLSIEVAAILRVKDLFSDKRIATTCGTSDPRKQFECFVSTFQELASAGSLTTTGVILMESIGVEQSLRLKKSIPEDKTYSVISLCRIVGITFEAFRGRKPLEKIIATGNVRSDHYTEESQELGKVLAGIDLKFLEKQTEQSKKILRNKKDRDLASLPEIAPLIKEVEIAEKMLPELKSSASSKDLSLPKMSLMDQSLLLCMTIHLTFLNVTHL